MIQRYQELVDNLQSKSDLARFSGDMGRLLEDAEAHFLHEERVMRNIQYPGYSEHKAAHQRLTEDFSDFMQNIGVGFSHKDLPVLTEYCRYWFITHVEEYDVKLKDYLDRTDQQPKSGLPRALLDYPEFGSKQLRK